jgi:hypothetical protein
LGLETHTQRAYILAQVKRGNLRGSLYDGYAWGICGSVKLRQGNGHQKSDTVCVEIQNAEPGQPPTAAGLKGFTKSRCQGKTVCDNPACPMLKHNNTQSVDYSREKTKLICIGLDGLGCGQPMNSSNDCTTVKYRLNLVQGHGNDDAVTVIVYHGDHSATCKEHVGQQCAKMHGASHLDDTSNVTTRVAKGLDCLMQGVATSANGQISKAVEQANLAKDHLRNCAPSQLKTPNHVKHLKRLTVEETTAHLRKASGLIVVPYHNAIGNLSVGPIATVTMHGCCRTAGDWQLAKNDPDYKYAAVNLLLACCDDQRVTDLMDPALVQTMNVPVSFDVQHPNKVSANFTMGYFSYVPKLRMMVNLANVMIPATDAYNGLSAKVGDNTKGNAHAKYALDLALRLHLQFVVPTEDLSNFTYRPRLARVADEGTAGIEGQRSNDGDRDVAEGSCEFHFAQGLDRLKNTFNAPENFRIFAQKANGVLHAEFDQVFWGLYHDIVLCLQNMPTEPKAIGKCGEFLLWHFSDKARRERLAKAYKPINASKSSVAEIGHAQQQRHGRKGVTLQQAIVVDAGLFVRQASDIKRYLDEGTVVRRKRGPDEYLEYTQQAAQAGNTQRAATQYSAVSELPMRNVVRADATNLSLADEGQKSRKISNRDSKIRLIAPTHHGMPEVFSGAHSPNYNGQHAAPQEEFSGAHSKVHHEQKALSPELVVPEEFSGAHSPNYNGQHGAAQEEFSGAHSKVNHEQKALSPKVVVQEEFSGAHSTKTGQRVLSSQIIVLDDVSVTPTPHTTPGSAKEGVPEAIYVTTSTVDGLPHTIGEYQKCFQCDRVMLTSRVPEHRCTPTKSKFVPEWKKPVLKLQAWEDDPDTIRPPIFQWNQPKFSNFEGDWNAIPVEKGISESSRQATAGGPKHTTHVDKHTLALTGDGNKTSGEEVQVATHRYDKQVLDAQAKTKTLYSTTPATGQKKSTALDLVEQTHPQESSTSDWTYAQAKTHGSKKSWSTQRT